MRPMLLLPFAFVIAACPAVTDVAPEEGCELPGPPAIDNLILNSALDADSGAWCVCVHLEWVDPADSAGGTAPNMHGGLFTMNAQGYELVSTWVDLPADQQQQPRGTFEVAVLPEESYEGAEIDFELRMRDRCFDRSNEKRGTYVLGSGKVVEEADQEGFAPQNPGVGCDAFACIIE